MGIKQSTPEKSASGKASSLFNNPRQPDLSRLRGALKFFMCNSEGFALRFAVFGVAAMTLFSALFLFPGYRMAWVIIGICAALIATAKKIVPISGNLPHWMKEEGPSPQRRRQL